MKVSRCIHGEGGQLTSFHNICVGEMKYGKIGEIKLSRYVTYILFCIQARSHNTHENKGTNRRRHKHYTFLFGV